MYAALLLWTLQDTAKVLAISRIMVAWQPVGIAAGVFDMCARYTGERQQFGAALGAFQLVQERLARMLGNVQAMFLMCWRLSKLYEQVGSVCMQPSIPKPLNGPKWCSAAATRAGWHPSRPLLPVWGVEGLCWSEGLSAG